MRATAPSPSPSRSPPSGTAVPKDGQVVLYTSGYDEASTLVTVPNFTGLDLVNANYVASLSGLQVSVSGSTGRAPLSPARRWRKGSRYPWHRHLFDLCEQLQRRDYRVTPVKHWNTKDKRGLE